MASRRFTILIADRTSGVVRRVTLAARPAVALACAVATIPVLAAGAVWKVNRDAAELYASERALQRQNDGYREATTELAGQVESLQAAIADLGARAALDPGLAHSMGTLPASVKARALGMTDAVAEPASAYAVALDTLADPQAVFAPLRGLLSGLESSLDAVRENVRRRNALADATPSIWPAYGWLSSAIGRRTHPTTGSNDWHSGLDIAGNRGQPVYATADGTVTHADLQGPYGKLIVIDHGFGLESRYGHLSSFGVQKGDHVKRGAMIGSLGSTGRATGPHLHYEVLADGRVLNPLRLLAQQRPRDR
jgi:murein DD-endopeptidase MepM/ murein hydrolase activator NlpD